MSDTAHCPPSAVGILHQNIYVFCAKSEKIQLLFGGHWSIISL